jgi:uncharacterized protein YndB with AHSA1/START domain
MKNTGTLKVTVTGERDVVLERLFDAPPKLVWEAMTRPELVVRWYGPHGYRLVVCEIDLRVGGAWRYVMRGPDGTDMGLGGVYRELVPGEKLISTEGYDAFPGSDAIATVVLTPRASKTLFTNTIVYPSREIRDMVVASGMGDGAAETLDRLNELLAAT